MSDNLQVIRDFIEAWSNLDADELVEYFTEDGIYYNMPAQPVQGKEQLKGFIGGFISNWTKTDWDLLNIVGEGDVVFAERLDRTVAGEVKVDLPCCGVFEMQDGKIKVWRDYFDMATFTKPFSQ
ncbi:MAG TPA: limonene-1,2-epoxide hydrolase family protein [Pseudomonadales bacterium]|jgi:limonene-1,2-epoxide hydrolase|nr:limonene-1,2-epoxide hydrolase [Gammaproteobacteria bacterium]MDP6025849.1 limonene-1,2-epoxide hydrolase family protein [Pseudomonadales bacterium]MDP6315597.1 limonene-1,2-epoxide hydrolase family protein [Pseudomonadales bacterium]MDP7316042.1 limonene-1,2-epoxide hydrolase family protein [Pseudomonadales bacterium]MDP7575775.1 limonene-1,2-epoxide hydrolase family protein [Pseudomonadales bacterium]|tara:strand:- start:1563 stop:1934 length:372 start_codon:yes stop_codon:yes gene_type:complete